MMNCNYKIGNETFGSYSELLAYIDKKVEGGDLTVLSATDIVYSKNIKQASQVAKIDKLKENYTPKIDLRAQAIIDGEVGFEGYLSILQFIDTPLANLITPFNVDDYKKNAIEKLEKEGKTREESEKIVDGIIDFWQVLQQDAIILHELFTDPLTKSSSSPVNEFIDKYNDKLPESLKDNPEVIRQLFYGLNKVYMKEKGSYPNSEVRSNVNLTTEIKGLSQKLIGHIDYLIIGEDGTLHLYLYKTTAEHPKDWVDAKKTKYKFNLAFLKQMLNQKGLDVKGITLNIVPVQLEYDQNTKKVTKVVVHNPRLESSTYSSNRWSMGEYDKKVKDFIDSNIQPTETITSSKIDRGLEVSRAIFPDLHIEENGIESSAKAWIARAPSIDPEGIEDLVIQEIGDQDHFYDVIIKGTVYPIKSKKPKNSNKEILDLVKKHLHELSEERSYSVQRIKDALRESWSKGFSTFNSVKGLQNMSSELNTIFMKYLGVTKDKDDNIVGHDWELIDVPSDSSILIFKNKKTNIIDVFVLSTFDLNTKTKFSKGSNILGSFKYNNEYVDLEANYGNIEVVRGMAILNEILPSLGDIKLGTIGAISTTNKSNYVRYTISKFYQKYYKEITSVVNTKNQDIKIKNNFNNYESANEITYLMEEYNKIISNKPESALSEYYTYGLDEIDRLETMSRHEQAEALLNMMTLINSDYPRFGKFSLYKDDLTSKGRNKDIAVLYDLIGKAYFYVTGNEIIRSTNSSSFEKTVNIPNVQSDPNLQYIANLLQITYDNISSEFDKLYNDNIRNPFNKFYKEIGYTAFDNMTLGNQQKTFKNLYELDVNGKKTMNFKNPYDYNNDLNPEERELLKNVLYQLHRITNPGFNINFTDEQKIKSYIKSRPDYLWVPLKRASKATTRANPKAIKAKFKNAFRSLNNLQQYFDEAINGITPEERSLLGNDSDEFYTFSLYNPFEMSTMLRSTGPKSVNDVFKSRHNLIEKYTPDFFETNLENILIDYYVEQIKHVQLNKFLTVSKALLLQLHLTGGMAGNDHVVKDEIKYIEDYIKLNVFNTSIMGNTEKAIIAVVKPVKSFVTDMLLGGNVIGAFRDITQGVLENFNRSLIGFNTNISSKSLTKAYAYVTTHSTSNAMAVNLLSRLCLKYRLSNTDISRVGERAKSGRNGIYNYDNLLYSTMRGPDFLNRMTLFVARCMEDGVWDAISIDENNNLHYDWKQDKRFSIYAQGSSMKGHPEYESQKAAYLSRVRQYNLDNPDKAIEYTDDLPEPYSNLEIMSIRGVADNIYGAYDKSKKAMMEAHALGITFAMFTTWMQGHINNYIMKPQKNNISRLLEVQDTDEQGNLLYWADDNSLTTENTGRPVMKNIPIICEGIFYSVGRLCNILRTEGWAAAKEHYKDNITVQQNVKKLVSDILVGGLLSILFKAILSGEYEKYKKTAKDNPVLQNLIIEILYKSTSRSYDSFLGLYNVINFIGRNSATPVYSVPTELLHNFFDIVFGEKSLETLLINNTGFGRSFKDTYKAYKKSQQ